ncbi:alpha/beta hydrolase [Litoribacillus peritrichatus]|uniref:alpha/beta hydrolase n=1 Tax=Litoribacillus peritrichatus TaxID=718191 RepID=UPI0031CE109D
MNKYLVAFLLFLTKHSMAGEVFIDFPSEIRADEKYIIYSHGLIVEGSNNKPVHTRFGVYEFNLIKNALVAGSDFNLIAEHRPKNTEIVIYARKLASWVKALVSAGVEPANITLVGFSRGGELTAYASSELNRLNINTVLLATCWPGSVQSKPEVTFGGNFLSVYETTDEALSCKDIANKSKDLISFKEISISTGKEHGAFFKPLEEWVTPVKQWINSKAVSILINDEDKHR